MRRLFVCCDGTWNAPEDRRDGVPVPTNVLKLYNSVAPRDERDPRAPIPQLRYYHPGVGTGEGVLRRILDGITGTGLSENVRSAYKWLADHYQPGDEIYLVGFSRGAFTVRSLAGMIRCCGLPPEPSWPAVDEAFRVYRLPKGRARSEARRATFREAHPSDPNLKIHFLGVWDTVGALGIPHRLDWLFGWLAAGHRSNRFHDTALCDRVTHAVHALAADEMRSSFAPTLWTSDPLPHQTLKQVWFPGVHRDVGGGYKETALSDATLQWMMGEAAGVGAAFDAAMAAQLRPDCRGVLHDSLSGLMKFVGSQPRSLPCLDGAGTAPRYGQAVADAIRDRRAGPPISQAPYRPTLALLPGQSVEVRVYARDYWNETGVYLEAGRQYAFAVVDARQTWLDWTRQADANGYRGNLLQRLAGRLKRVPEANWFCLCGAVADALMPSVAGDPPPITQFAIGIGRTHACRQGGYLYLFANDVPGFYFNNRGSLLVRISCV